MKRILIFIVSISSVSLSYASDLKVTGEAALASSKASQLANSPGYNVPSKYATRPKETGSGGSNKHYSVSAHETAREVAMEPTATYNCALSGVEGDYRGWMEQGKVFERGGRWILYARAGGTTVVARGVCFPK